MTRQLRVLIVEDSESDAALVLRCLQRGGYEPRWERVETASEMRAALNARTWDVVLCDYRLPQFDASSALETLRQAGGDIPFIVVSGMIGEETAVSLMKAGAQDYLRKDNMTRLVAVVEREIQEARERSCRREAEISLRASESRFQTLVAMAPEAIFIGSDRHFTYANAAAVRLLRASGPEEVEGRPIIDFLDPAYHERMRELVRVVTESRKPSGETEVICRTLDGEAIHVAASAVPFGAEGESGLIVFARDITERKLAEDALREQLDELRRWHEATLGRESRILELKDEVNQLLAEAGRPLRYGTSGAVVAAGRNQQSKEGADV